MHSKPVIFISAVSGELKSARQLVANTLTFLGYEPDWQEIFGTGQGDLRRTLRQRIDAADGVLQVVGQCYGSEPHKADGVSPLPDAAFGRVSYAQYEARYATKRGKRVWYILLGKDFPAAPENPEPDELRDLQDAYREGVCTAPDLYHDASTPDALQLRVHELRNELAQLRRSAKHRAALVLVLLLLLAAGTARVLQSQRHSAQLADHTHRELLSATTKLAETNRELVSAKAELAETNRNVLLAKAENAETNRNVLLAKTENAETNRNVLSARTELANIQKDVLSAKDEHANTNRNVLSARTELADARTEFADTNKNLLLAKTKLDDTHREVLLAKTKLDDLNGKVGSVAIGVSDVNRKIDLLSEGVNALPEILQQRLRELPLQSQGQSWQKELSPAQKARQAEEELKQAEDYAYEMLAKQLGIEAKRLRVEMPALARQLKDAPNTPPLERANAAYVAKDYTQARDLALKAAEASPGAAPPRTSEAIRAYELASQVAEERLRYQEALDSLRQAERLTDRQRDGGEWARVQFALARVISNLANVLAAQGKLPESEEKYREVLALRMRMPGPEHTDTYRSKWALASVLQLQGKDEEAEPIYWEAIRFFDQKLGADDPNTFGCRNNLGALLCVKGSYEAAEKVLRAAITPSERVLGPGHADTLQSRSNLAVALAGQDKLPEAEREYRSVIKTGGRVLGTDHLEMVRAYYNLAGVLADLADKNEDMDQYQEALKYARLAEQGWLQHRGPAHRDSKDAKARRKEIEEALRQ
jgi:hypothetical protein